MGWREILPFVAAQVGAQRPDVSHAHHNPIVSKNPWLNKNSWFLEVMGGHWNSSNYVINFGAHYDARKPERDIDDVVSEHMRSNAAIGLAVDADDPMKWAGKNIVRRTQFLVPDGVAALLDGAGCPAMPRLLKVDIDSFDVVVVRAVLSVRKPAFVYVEINEKFPPPVCYCNDRYLKRWRRLDGDAYGCSLLGYVEALRPFGYALVSVALNDALFARGDVQAEVARRLPGRKLPTPLAAWKLGYGEVHNIHERFPWNYKNWPFYTETVPMAPPFGRESLLARQPLRGMLRQVAGLVRLLQIHRTPDSTRGTSTSGRLMEQRRKSKARGWNQRGTWARLAKSLLRTWARMHLLTPGMPRPASRC